MSSKVAVLATLSLVALSSTVSPAEAQYHPIPFVPNHVVADRIHNQAINQAIREQRVENRILNNQIAHNNAIAARRWNYSPQWNARWASWKLQWEAAHGVAWNAAYLQQEINNIQLKLAADQLALQQNPLNAQAALAVQQDYDILYALQTQQAGGLDALSSAAAEDPAPTENKGGLFSGISDFFKGITDFTQSDTFKQLPDTIKTVKDTFGSLFHHKKNKKNKKNKPATPPADATTTDGTAPATTDGTGAEARDAIDAGIFGGEEEMEMPEPEEFEPVYHMPEEHHHEGRRATKVKVSVNVH